MTDDGIVFEDPPPKKRPSAASERTQAIVAQLKEHPEQWARIKVGHTTLTTGIKNGLGAYGPKGSFEATSRVRPDGKYDIYARYVGKD